MSPVISFRRSSHLHGPGLSIELTSTTPTPSSTKDPDLIIVQENGDSLDSLTRTTISEPLHLLSNWFSRIRDLTARRAAPSTSRLAQLHDVLPEVSVPSQSLKSTGSRNGLRHDRKTDTVGEKDPPSISTQVPAARPLQALPSNVPRAALGHQNSQIGNDTIQTLPIILSNGGALQVSSNVSTIPKNTQETPDSNVVNTLPSTSAQLLTISAPPVTPSNVPAVVARADPRSLGNSNRVPTPSSTGSQTAEHSHIRLDNKHFVSVEMPIPEESLSLWEIVVKPRLQNALRQMPSSGSEDESSLALEFYMVGTRATNLKPTIVVTCCSTGRKRELRYFLATQRWFQNSELRTIVTVNTSFGYRTDSFISARTDRLFAIQAAVTKESLTMCGIHGCIVSKSLDSSAKFTIGGVVCLDDTPMLLTVSHRIPSSWKTGFQTERNATISLDNNPDNDSPRTSSESIDLYRTANGLTSIKNRTVISVSQYLARKYKRRSQGEEFSRSTLLDLDCIISRSYSARIFRRSGHFNQIQDRDTGLDWALLSPQELPDWPNSFQPQTTGSTGRINAIIRNDEMSSGTVWIIAGSGLRSGTLDIRPASVFLGGMFHEVKLISLEKCLEHGDSGSWVIRNDRLCGYVIAGKDSPPWAYMVCIEDVFLDIENFCSKTSFYAGEGRITLPSDKSQASGNSGQKSLSAPLRIPETTVEVVNNRSTSISSDLSINGSHHSSQVIPLTTRPEIDKIPQEQAEVAVVELDEVHTSDSHLSIKTAGFAKQLLFFAIVFLVSIMEDGDYINVAIPSIAREFRSADAMGWYGSAFKISKAAFLLPYLALCRTHPEVAAATAILTNIGGHLMCGFAQSSTVFIGGRTLAGVGASGVFVFGRLQFKEFPTVTTTIAIMLSDLSTPIIFGSFASTLTWRWCFFLTSICGGCLFLLLALLPHHYRVRGPGQMEPMVSVFAFFAALGILPLLAINWGGRKYNWKDVHVIVPLVFFVSWLLYFLILTRIASKSSSAGQMKYELGSIWNSKFRDRALWSVLVFQAAIWASKGIMWYYLPLWFQIVKRASPLKSSIMQLSYTLSITISAVGYLLTIKWIKYRKLPMIFTSLVASVGAGCLCLFKPDTTIQTWVALIFVFASSLGPSINVPTEIIRDYTTHYREFLYATSVNFYTSLVIESLFLTVAQSIFANSLSRELGEAWNDLPGKDFEHKKVPRVVDAYNDALVKVFYLATALAACSMIGAYFSRWTRVNSEA